MKLIFKRILLGAALLLIPVVGIKAAKTANDSVFVPADEVIAGNLFALAQEITVEGAVSGDLIVAGRSITVNGRVEGDIIAAGQNIVINGEVGGNIRILGNYLAVDAIVTRNINAFGADVFIGEKTRVGWDMIIGARTARVGGQVNGSLSAYVQKIFFSGKVGKNFDISAYGQDSGQAIVLDRNATVNGDLNYSAKNPADLSADAIVSGQINFKQLQPEEKNIWDSWVWSRLFSFLSILFIGLIFIFIIPKHSRALLAEVKSRPLKSLIFGGVFILILPPLTLILIFTVIGLPFAAILFGLWLAGIFLAKTVAALITGELILQNLFKRNSSHLFWTLLLGSVLLSLLFSIPYAGHILRLTAICFGVGAILTYAANRSQNI